MLPIYTSVSRWVIQSKEFNPNDSCYFGINPDWWPLPFLEESVHFFITDLAMGKPVLAFCGRDGLEVVVFQVVMFLVPYLSFRFHPLFGIVTKDVFLFDLLFVSLPVFRPE